MTLLELMNKVYRVLEDHNDMVITGDDVIITLKELFELMKKVSNKIGTRISEAEWESWTSGFHADVQMDVEKALKHREGLI